MLAYRSQMDSVLPLSSSPMAGLGGHGELQVDIKLHSAILGEDREGGGRELHDPLTTH